MEHYFQDHCYGKSYLHQIAASIFNPSVVKRKLSSLGVVATVTGLSLPVLPCKGRPQVGTGPSSSKN